SRGSPPYCFAAIDHSVSAGRTTYVRSGPAPCDVRATSPTASAAVTTTISSFPNMCSPCYCEHVFVSRPLGRPRGEAAGAGRPAGGEERRVRGIGELGRRDARPSGRQEPALPAPAHPRPVLGLSVPRRLVHEQEPLDVGDRRVAREVPLDRLADVLRLRLLGDDGDVLLVEVLEVRRRVRL